MTQYVIMKGMHYVHSSGVGYTRWLAKAKRFEQTDVDAIQKTFSALSPVPTDRAPFDSTDWRPDWSGANNVTGE